MCHFNTISWRDLPWWFKAGMVCSFMFQVAFVVSFVAYAHFGSLLLPDAISQVMTAVIAPVDEAGERLMSNYKEYYALEQERHERKILQRMHEYCLSLYDGCRNNEPNPELTTYCREHFRRMNFNAFGIVHSEL